VEAAVFGLMGLLIAFTFSGAAARFDSRRAQLVEEANCIGTAFIAKEIRKAKDCAAFRILCAHCRVEAGFAIGSRNPTRCDGATARRESETNSKRWKWPNPKQKQ
jgi:hypothetical protein